MKPSAVDQAISAARSGDFTSAVKGFRKAIRKQPRQASHRYNFAIYHMQRGDAAAAASQLCEALKIEPNYEEAATRLSSLLAKYQLPADCKLNSFGLRAALNFFNIDHQAIAAAAFSQVRQHTIMADLLLLGKENGYDTAAQELLSFQGLPLLTDRLFLAALRAGVNRNQYLEFMLTQSRRLLLLGGSELNIGSSKIFDFAAALAHQCHNTEFVYPLSDDEREGIEALEAQEFSVQALISGDKKSAETCILLGLYKPIDTLVDWSGHMQSLAGLKPPALSQLVCAIVPQAQREAEIAASLPSLGALEDDVSRRVANQYEANPYPRWLSLPKPPENTRQTLLETVFGNKHPETFNGVHDILVAGAGTGRQAIYSSMVHGPKSRILAIDLSKRSLAYGARMAEEFGCHNIEFMQADILDLAGLNRRFDVIECSGVLHHMNDPFLGWRKLLAHLKPAGVMLVALYSAVSRKNIAALRNSPDYPGAGCNDDALRRYRAGLMANNDPLVQSEDFYTLSDFRDLVLHEHERQLTIPEISEFLNEAGLDFCGFVLPPEQTQAYASAFPQDQLPGSLENWWQFEQDNPHLFDAMYQFWCRKPA